MAKTRKVTKDYYELKQALEESERRGRALNAHLIATYAANDELRERLERARKVLIKGELMPSNSDTWKWFLKQMDETLYPNGK